MISVEIKGYGFVNLHSSVSQKMDSLVDLLFHDIVIRN